MKDITITVNDSGGITNVDFVAWIMNEIEGKQYKRKEVAHTYSILIQKGHKDFKAINEAILKRWSPAGLRWIKETAWRWAQSDTQRTADLGLV